MMPRLHAEEALSHIETTAIGTGSMRKDSLRRAVAAIERTAQGERRPKAVRATPEMLAAMGIGIQQVNRGA